MKYIIDLDALKDCLELLAVPHKKDLVSVEAVNKMIDKFPKEECKEEKKTTTTAKTKAVAAVNEDNQNAKTTKKEIVKDK